MLKYGGWGVGGRGGMEAPTAKMTYTKLEFVFYVKTDVSPLLEWCSFVQKVKFWYSKGV